jgi:predicted fused transcriptional regulator/phosphomethylpyrimidine kinase
MTEQEYQQSVMDDFEKRGFTLSSFKGKNNWQEVLDPEWDWNTFDYKIPNYDNSKSIDDVITHDTGTINNDIDNFVNHDEHDFDVKHDFTPR